MAPLHEGVIYPTADREGLFFSDFCGENHRPRRGRSAGPDFSPMRNRGKNRQRRGLPPPCGIHPAVRGVRLRSSLFGPWPSSCHIDSFSVYGLYLLLCWYNLLPSGPSLVCNCSQLPEAWLPAVGTPLTKQRPGRGNCQAAGPVAVVAWCHGSARTHSKDDGPSLDLTQFQPSTPGGYLGGNALGGFW